MGGGLMQLVAYGAQDIYLTGNPQITFFKVVYRRHTNFSMESIVQTFSGTAKFDSEVVATISRNGDLVGRMYLEHTGLFAATGGQTALVEYYGHSLIKECEIEIGGQRIDKHTSMWNRVYSDLTEFNPSGHFGVDVKTMPTNGDVVPDGAGTGTLYQLMTGNGYGLCSDANGGGTPMNGVNGTGATVNGFKYTDTGGDGTGSVDIGRIFLPLNFWFNRNPGLALPLIALQYHEVKVKINFESLNNLARMVTNAGGEIMSGTFKPAIDPGSVFNLWCDYIYLDTDERRRFAQVSHEYLIEQLQYSETTVSSQTPSINLNFNHPVKELIWCTRNEGTQGRCMPIGTADDPDAGDWSAGPVSLSAMAGTWQLKLNGHDRFKERESTYFTRTQVWQHHTGYGAPVVYGDKKADGGGNESAAHGLDSIAVYSFALKPEEHQPSGTCNFSRIDNAQLVGSGLEIETEVGDGAKVALAGAGTANMVLTIFAVNYNVLRIMSGMGGLAYSN